MLIDNVIKENLRRRKEKLSTGHSFSLNVAYFYNQSCRNLENLENLQTLEKLTISD